jgi:FixJ family two-component response regulator
VLDLQMPGPSGLELQEALAQAEELLPVIFVTAHGDISSSVRAMKQGAIDFLTKPVQGDELLEAVLRALAQGAAERQTRRKKAGGSLRSWSTACPISRSLTCSALPSARSERIAPS